MAKTNEISIWSEKTYEFDSPGGEKHVVPYKYVGPVPAWVGKTELFKLAREAGNIKVIETLTDKVAAENGDLDAQELKNAKARAKELKIPNYTKMDLAQLTEAIEAAVAAQQTELNGKGE